MKRPLRTLGILLAVSVLPFTGLAADHGDSPTAGTLGEPTADITDLYAWQDRDGPNLNLVLAVSPNAGEDAKFSDAITYVFHIASSPAYNITDPRQVGEAPVICKFVDDTNIECWAGDDYVVGDPSTEAGIVSDNGDLRVFAGLRDDPFFLNLTAFQTTVTSAVQAAPTLVPTDGCPDLSAEQSAALVGALTSAGSTPVNYFAGQKVLALVIQLNTAQLKSGGPVLSVWASTHAGAVN